MVIADYLNEHNSTFCFRVLPYRDIEAQVWYGFLARFGGIICSFGLAKGIYERVRLVKTMARVNSPDLSPKRTKYVRLGIYMIIRVLCYVYTQKLVFKSLTLTINASVW